MDMRITNVCLFYDNIFLAIDQAVWMNFQVRNKGVAPFLVVEGANKDLVVVSRDVLALFKDPIEHPLFGDYIPMDYDHIEMIAMDKNPPEPWEIIRGMFSTLDGEILRYILHMDIPLEKFIRYELAARGFDKEHRWCGFEKAKEIWLEEE